VALISTLGLAAVVAIVAVTRGEQKTPAAEASPTPSATATGSASPGGLNGEGPYVVYAKKSDVFAYDVATGTTVALGSIDGTAASERSRQPGSGKIVAFPTTDGSVWSIKRTGMSRVGVVPSAAGDDFEGAAVSPDGRRIAIGAVAPDAATVIVDLQSGHSTVLERVRKGRYPPEPLLPVGWSLGGDLIYEIPYCQCGQGAPGLYAVDDKTGAATIVTGTRSTPLYTFAMSSSGQSLYYGTGTPRRCGTGEEGPCAGRPFFLRRIASGRRGVETLKRASDAGFTVMAISQNGDLLLVTRVEDAASHKERNEVYGSEGDRAPSIRGVPSGATPVALLPRDVVVALGATTSSIIVVRGGRAQTVVLTEGDAPVYLGWLS
jgi:hypothetical protein